MSKYVLGIDFGTESGRVLLVNVDNGQHVASVVYPYPHGVIDEKLPLAQHTVHLPPDWALQDPEDYLHTLKNAIPTALKEAGISADDVIGVGIDFTSCTMLPVKADGTPLCTLPQYRANPHAWVKLWKHHAAQPQADRINALAQEMGQPWLARYGGKVSSEWFFPKVLQILEEAPEIYEHADRMIEAADWIVWQLTGVETRNSCSAGYKALWSKREGFPSSEYFAALHPRMRHVVDEKMSRRILPIGSRAGYISAQAAAWTGLKEGTAVAVPIIDAHAAVPGATVTQPGRMVMVMGTSTCHMVLSQEEYLVPGICGVVEDGIIPGLFGYEAGQSCVGDHFAWFAENCTPASYEQEAHKRNLDIHSLLEEKAAQLRPGESGLLALDWWNGNRSTLMDANLSGLLVGMTLATKPEEIYRALIEATAYGTRVIIETFATHQVPIDELVASGGLPEKNKLLMQIYADVTGREIKVEASGYASALGACMLGAVAAGKDTGGHDTLTEAAQKIARLKNEVYRPIPENQTVYEQLYAEYLRLYNEFGRGENNVMKILKNIRAEIKRGTETPISIH